MTGATTMTPPHDPALEALVDKLGTPEMDRAIEERAERKRQQEEQQKK